MANPASIDNLPAVLEVTSTPSSVTLSATRSYTFSHNGVDTSGSADVNAIFCSIVAAVDADFSNEADKFILQSDREVIVGPNVTELKFGTAAGAPTMNCIPGT